jgi:hypothetical protein
MPAKGKQTLVLASLCTVHFGFRWFFIAFFLMVFHGYIADIVILLIACRAVSKVYIF